MLPVADSILMQLFLALQLNLCKSSRARNSFLQECEHLGANFFVALFHFTKLSKPFHCTDCPPPLPWWVFFLTVLPAVIDIVVLLPDGNQITLKVHVHSNRLTYSSFDLMILLMNKL